MKRLEYKFSKKGSSSLLGITVDSSDEQPKVSRRRLDENSYDKSPYKPIVRSYNRTNFPRLRWSNELHQIFENVVESLGGVERATTKMVLQMMNVKGVTVSHIKSHLQMCRSMKKERNRKDGEMVEGALTISSSHDDREEVVELTTDQLLAKEPLMITMPNPDHTATVTQDLITNHNYQQEDSEYKGEENGVDGSAVAAAVVFKDFFNTRVNGGHEGLASSSFGSNMESAREGPYASFPKASSADDAKNVSLELTLG